MLFGVDGGIALLAMHGPQAHLPHLGLQVSDFVVKEIDNNKTPPHAIS